MTNQALHDTAPEMLRVLKRLLPSVEWASKNMLTKDGKQQPMRLAWGLEARAIRRVIVKATHS